MVRLENHKKVGFNRSIISHNEIVLRNNVLKYDQSKKKSKIERLNCQRYVSLKCFGLGYALDYRRF